MLEKVDPHMLFMYAEMELQGTVTGMLDISHPNVPYPIEGGVGQDSMMESISLQPLKAYSPIEETEAGKDRDSSRLQP